MKWKRLHLAPSGGPCASALHLTSQDKARFQMTKTPPQKIRLNNQHINRKERRQIPSTQRQMLPSEVYMGNPPNNSSSGCKSLLNRLVYRFMLTVTYMQRKMHKNDRLQSLVL